MKTDINIPKISEERILKICCDASVNGTWVCAGATCINTGESDYRLISKATNNRGEIYAILMSIHMGYNICIRDRKYDLVEIYSDSQISVSGLNDWMDDWVANSKDGVLRTKANKPVSNQDIFKNILWFLSYYRFPVKIRHISAHVPENDKERIKEANEHYCSMYKQHLKKEKLISIIHNNNIVDVQSRYRLDPIGILNENDFSLQYMVIRDIPFDYNLYLR